MFPIQYLSFLLLPFFSLIHFILFPNIIYYSLHSKETFFQTLFLPFIGIPFLSYLDSPQNFPLLSAIGVSLYGTIPTFIEIFFNYYQSQYFDKRGFVIYLLTAIEYIILYLVRNNPYHIILSYMVYYTITYVYTMFNTNSPTLPIRQMERTAFYMVAVILIYFYNIYFTQHQG